MKKGTPYSQITNLNILRCKTLPESPMNSIYLLQITPPKKRKKKKDTEPFTYMEPQRILSNPNNAENTTVWTPHPPLRVAVTKQHGGGMRTDTQTRDF